VAIVLPTRRVPVDRARIARRIFIDRWAAQLVTGGGIVIIASILAIVAVILWEVVPLFRPARVEPAGGAAIGAPASAIGVDEYRETAYALTPTGRFELRPLAILGRPGTRDIAGLDGATVTAAVTIGPGRHLLGTSDGRAIPVDVKFDVKYDTGKRTLVPDPQFGTPLTLEPDRKRPVVRLTGALPEGGPVIVTQSGLSDLMLLSVVQRKALIGPSTSEQAVQALALPPNTTVTAMAMDRRGEDLFLGTSTGQMLRYDLRDRANPTQADVVTATRGGAAINVLGFLNGDRTLVVGDSAGAVATWQIVPAPAGAGPRIARVHEFERHGSAVTAMSPSQRDKGFATADADGAVHLHYATSGRTLVKLKGGGQPIASLTFAPKADGIISADTSGRLSHWYVDNPHPEVTFGTLFGKVWYEGYAGPEYVWQSTGGTDDFEAKLSLTPLIFGTLKGTFYALFFAVPLALLAAVYVSEFMHPDLRSRVKPAVEIMAALPSVVLGFLAGLWLAPLVEQVVPGFVLLPPVLTLAILATLLVWRRIPQTRGVRPGTEAAVLVPVVAAGTYVAFALGGVLEGWLLGGDYRGFIRSVLGLGFDQRNSLVVGIAMGFAVVPIIFTIAEDSLTNVPQHLRAGSLALGATRWQTAVRIVLPTASPGIFSAIMIGFGRAVGETMIVLMATGNTPVMDWNVFSGFRALSANIAVELPEAPETGTLFRVLFLAAFLLFCFTFFVNTIAEVVRIRLRRRYQFL
jgi:phosphate transport system permease protein